MNAEANVLWIGALKNVSGLSPRLGLDCIMTMMLTLVLVDGDRSIVAAVKRLLRGRPVNVVDFDEPRSAMAYLSAINAPVEAVWTDLGFRDAPLGIEILELAAFRSPRPEIFLVTAADLPRRPLPAGTRVFDKTDLRKPVARIEEMLRVPGDPIR